MAHSRRQAASKIRPNAPSRPSKINLVSYCSLLAENPGCSAAESVWP